MTTMSGYLLASPTSKGITRELLTVGHPPGGPKVPSIRFLNTLFQLRQWEEFELLSDTALADEVIGGAVGPPYTYKLLCVTSGAKVIVVSERKRITDYAINRVYDRRIYPNLRKVAIRIDKLIEACQSTTSEYLITSLHGRFSGSERHVRTMSLYGDDVTESAIFRTHNHLFNFYSCGIGRRLFENLPRLSPADDGEILRLGNDGFLSFTMRDRDHALDVMMVINYVIRQRWVEDWVPGIEPEDSSTPGPQLEDSPDG